LIDRLRVPFLVIALILIALVVLAELGALLLGVGDKPPGFGIAFMGFIDGTLLVTIGLDVLSMLIGSNLEGRIQGIVTLIYSIVVIIGGIISVFLVFQLLLLMLALLLSIPFGTAVYLAVWGNFDTGAANAILGFIMLLKIAFAVCLVLAEQRFLQAKGLVFMVIVSLVANIVVGFLQSFPPGFLASITDAIAAIVMGIVGIILALVLLVFAVIAVVRALALNRNLVG
jgi:hypothetical protein